MLARERPGLQMHIAATESVPLCTRMIQSDCGAMTIMWDIENRFAQQRLRGARN